MKKIIDVLEEIEKLQGTNVKKDLLKQLLNDDKNARDFFEIVYGDIVFGVSSRSFEKVLGFDKGEELSKYEDAGEMIFNNIYGTKHKTFEEFVSFCEQVKNLSGNAQLDFIQHYYENMLAIEAKWFTRAILKNLRIGVSLVTVNNALEELKLKTIDKFEVQLCGSFANIEDYDLGFPCIVCVKYDGMRAVIEKTGENIIITSRQGKTIEFVPEIEEELKKYFHDFIIDGEIMCNNFNELQQRIGRKADNIKPINGLHFCVFDLLKFDELITSKMMQMNRSKLLAEKFDESDLLKIEERIVVDNQFSLEEFYKSMCDRKEEGIIIKLINKPYEYDSRTNWWKVKPIYESVFVVTGVTKGAGKFKKTIGALLIEDASGKVKSRVGSGINDEMRDILFNMNNDNNLIGTLVEVKYNEITKNKDGSHSLRFPRLLKIRSDLDKADELKFS